MEVSDTLKSQIVIQRDNQLLITPGHEQLEIANIVRWCAVLEAVVAGSLRYRLSPVAVWGAATRGVTAERMLEALDRHAAVPLPAGFVARLADLFQRYGELRLMAEGSSLWLEASHRAQAALHDLELVWSAGRTPIEAGSASRIKLEAARRGWPVVDKRHEITGSTLSVQLQPSVSLRPYQRQAVNAYIDLGSGMVLLPCGAGKTIVGVAALVATGRNTLILTPSQTIARQWESTILSSTTLDASQVSLLQRGHAPAQVSITTYQSATRGIVRSDLLETPWGLIIFDEAHSLPATVFRQSAELQAGRRLGLTATLVREDEREAEVFALVGPVIHDVPWYELEAQGWISPADCIEVRLPKAPTTRDAFRYRLAAVERLLALHQDEPALVIGSRLAGLEAVARQFDLPIMTGKTPDTERKRLLEGFRAGDISTLVVSNVGSAGVDLPNASVMIQLSGNFGSRQEEAQRLGRLLRPAEGKIAKFYTLVVESTRDGEYARRRQRFLVDQGYRYRIFPASELKRP